MNERIVCQSKSRHPLQQLVESSRIGDEFSFVDCHPPAAMLGGVIGKPLKVLRPIRIERVALAHFRRREKNLKT